MPNQANDGLGRLGRKVQESVRLGRAVRLAWQAAPGLVVAGCVLLVLQGVVPLAGLLCAKGAVDAVAAGASSTRTGAYGDAVFWLALAAVVGVLSAALGGASSVVTEAQSQKVTDHVGDLLHRRSMEVDFGYYEDPAFHDTLHRAQQEAPYRPSRIVSGLAQLLQHGVSLVAMAGILASLRWWMAVALLGAAFPGLFARLQFSNRLFVWQKTASSAERKSWYLHALMTMPSFAAEVRLFGLGPLLRERFSSVRSVLRSERLTLGRRRSVADSLAQASAALVAFGIFCLVARDAVTGAITLGAFVMYFGAFQRGLSSLQGLLGSLAGLYEDNLFLQNLDEFLSLPVQVIEPTRPRPFPSPLTEGLRLDGVRFRYRSSASWVLDGVSLSLGPGEIVALVGPNGSGKSTLVKLLLRLYDPYEGRITVDGVDLREIGSADLRRRMAVLLQDFGRYAFSARENIWIGDVDAPPMDPRIEEAAHQSGADAVVAGLPRSWDTVLGGWFEDGRELSTGQWQKVALARTLFRNAEIVVLDEPSAALDPLSERRLFESFRHLVAGRSAIFISHRFSTVRMADRIAVLDSGRLVEDGPHDELIRRGGIYSRMYSAQAEPHP